jgi:hypothetical protein
MLLFNGLPARPALLHRGLKVHASDSCTELVVAESVAWRVALEGRAAGRPDASCTLVARSPGLSESCALAALASATEAVPLLRALSTKRSSSSPGRRRRCAGEQRVLRGGVIFTSKLAFRLNVRDQAGSAPRVFRERGAVDIVASLIDVAARRS